MATPYSQVYDAALFYFRDNTLLTLIQSEAEEILRGYMMRAIAEFTPICKHDLTDRDEVLQQFNDTLTEIEVDILALGMAVKWTQHHVLFVENLRDKMSSKDYTYHSRATLLGSLNDTLAMLQRQFRNRMMNYSYDNGDISSLHM